MKLTVYYTIGINKRAKLPPSFNEKVLFKYV